MDIFSGYKTYFTAFVLAAAGILEGPLGIDIPGVTVDGNWLTLLLGVLGLSSLRAAVGKVLAK